jgi:hypothetical protein
MRVPLKSPHVSPLLKKTPVMLFVVLDASHPANFPMPHFSLVEIFLWMRPQTPRKLIRYS